LAPVSAAEADSAVRATPKSTSTTVPSDRMIRLPGFTSRCTMPAWWAASRACPACATIDIVSAAVSRPRSAIRWLSASPSTRAITMYASAPSPVCP
jgi:hypothetical protein